MLIKFQWVTRNGDTPKYMWCRKIVDFRQISRYGNGTNNYGTLIGRQLRSIE